MSDSYFSTRFRYDPWRDIVWFEIARFLEPWISANGQVLDLGDGYCHLINALKASKRYALDIFPAIKNYTQVGVESIVSPVNDLSAFADQTLDTVLASNLFEHLTDEEFEQTLMEIKRVLKPIGRLIVIQPNFRYAYREYFDDYTHRKIFTDQGLSDRLRASGFVIEVVKARFIPFSLASARGLRIPRWFIRFYLKSPWKPKAKQMLIIARLAV